jgi:MoaA/NifB/PqqE/SkfB family radical SAM enzyme
LTELRKEKQKDLLITASGIVCNENLDSYLDLVDLVLKLGVDCLMVEALETQDEPISKDRLDELDALVVRLIELKSTEGVIENSSDYLEMLKEFYRGNRVLKKCYAPYSFCAVDCFGNVFPCWQWIQQNKSLGNIKDSSLREIWHSSQYNKIRKELKNCNACAFHCHTEMNLLYKWFDAFRR